MTTAGGKKLAACWFHTAFVEGDELIIPKLQLDKARKNKQLPSDFALVIKLSALLNADDEARERASLQTRGQGSEREVPGAEDDSEEEDEEGDKGDAADKAEE